ncbi:MAG: molybdate ABC transporter substrate-binding protein [Acidobacteria bacterium]|nr:molybdate ABC transporter substrate-binding protein [Acidobacteriota bacterium]
MTRRPILRLAVALLFAATGVLAAATQRQTPPVAGPLRADVVRVAAAADLKFALDEIAARLVRQQPPIRIQPTYGSSGNMHAQLQQRAPFDIYLSADVEYPRDLVRRGIGSERDLFTYARGKLVVWVRKQSKLEVEREGWAALRSARRIAIANPRHAPYGRAAEQALRGAGLWQDEGGRIVLGENVAQAAQFVDSGAADVGIIAKSLALAPVMRSAGRFWDVPEDAYMPLQQGGLILPWAVSRDAAARVRDYLLSDTGRTLLTSYGFALPEN